MAATYHNDGQNAQNTGLASFSITCTISAGDGVVFYGSWDQASTTTPTVATTGGTGSDSFTLVYGPFTSGNYKYGAWLLQSAGTGRTGATISWASSNPSFADGDLLSFSGLTNPVLDGTGFATGSSATPTSTNTATLTSTDEIAVGYAATSGTVGGASGAWTYNGPIGGGVTGSGSERQILTATTAIQATFTSTGTWICFVLTFRAAPTALASIHFNVGQNSNPPTSRMVGY